MVTMINNWDAFLNAVLRVGFISILKGFLPLAKLLLVFLTIKYTFAMRVMSSSTNNECCALNQILTIYIYIYIYMYK